MKTIHEKVFEEISVLILNNLELLYNYNDDTLLDIRKYCYENKSYNAYNCNNPTTNHSIL